MNIVEKDQLILIRDVMKKCTPSKHDINYTMQDSAFNGSLMDYLNHNKNLLKLLHIVMDLPKRRLSIFQDEDAMFLYDDRTKKLLDFGDLESRIDSLIKSHVEN